MAKPMPPLIPIEKRGSRAPQPSLKGCSCKRSQCIKNYCDCYQSMAICSKYCKCVGCLNTEVRKLVSTAPSKSSSAVKRERAAALTAKAAAAAAKAAINVGHAKSPVPPDSSKFGRQLPFGMNLINPNMMGVMPMPPQPLQMMQLPAAANLLQPPAPAQTGPGPGRPPLTTVPLAKPVKQKTPSPLPPPPPPPRETNVFTPIINAALLDCIISQAAEAEEVGLEEVQVGQLVLHELTRGISNMLHTVTPP